MDHIVYILYSEKLAKHYAGNTNNIDNRLITHNQGGKKFTSKGIPWKLVKTYSCENRIEAVRLEMKIKKRGIKRYLDEH